MWKILKHPNVLPLICASMNDDEFVMVSEWMDNGNVIDYLTNKAPDADRLSLVIFFPSLTHLFVYCSWLCNCSSLISPRG